MLVGAIISLFVAPMGLNTAAASRFAGREIFRNAISNRMAGGMGLMRGAGLFLGSLLVAGFGVVLHLLAGDHEQSTQKNTTITETKPTSKN